MGRVRVPEEQGAPRGEQQLLRHGAGGPGGREDGGDPEQSGSSFRAARVLRIWGVQQTHKPELSLSESLRLTALTSPGSIPSCLGFLTSLPATGSQLS